MSATPVERLHRRVGSEAQSRSTRRALASVLFLIERSDPDDWPTRDEVGDLIDAWWEDDDDRMADSFERLDRGEEPIGSEPRYFVVRAPGGPLDRLPKAIFRCVGSADASDVVPPKLDFSRGTFKEEVTRLAAAYEKAVLEGPTAQRAAGYLLDLLDGLAGSAEQQWGQVQDTAERLVLLRRTAPETDKS